MDSSVCGILKARIAERVAISYSEDLLNPGIKPMSHLSPALADGFFITALAGKPICALYLLATRGQGLYRINLYVSEFSTVYDTPVGTQEVSANPN